MVLWIKIKVIYFSIKRIFRFEQYTNETIGNFVYYGKTRFHSKSRIYCGENNIISSFLVGLFNTTFLI